MSVFTFLAFIAALAAAAIATRIRPSFGIAAMIFVDPFTFEHHLSITTITLPKVVLVGVIFGLIARRESPQALWELPTRWLLVAFLAILAATALTAIPGLYIDVVVREVLKSLEYVAIFSVAAIAFAADPDERVVWSALAIAATLVCALALREGFLGAHSAAFIEGRTVSRIAGPLEGPNQLAGYLEITIAMLLARATMGGNRIAMACVVLAVVTDVLTLSRAGLLGLAFGIVAIAARVADRAQPRIILGAFVVAFAGGCVLLAHIGALDRVFSIGDVDFNNGLGSRDELWSAALQFFFAHPLLGIGAGNFELQLSTLGIIGVRTHANSLYLQSLAEGGVVLFAANVAAIVVAVRCLYFVRARGALALGAGAATIALAAHQIFDTMTFFPKVGGFWCLCLGIAAARVAKTTTRETSPS